MTNTILIFNGPGGQEIRVAADAIQTYYEVGGYTEITLKTHNLTVANTKEEIDAALAESFYMIKKVQ